MTLGEWLDKWLAEYISLRIRPSTLSGYKNYVNNYIKPVLGNKVISKIEPSDVRKMYTKLKKEGRINYHPQMGHSLSNKMIRSIHGVLHGAMEVARQEGLIAKNPTVGAVLPKDTPKPKRILNETELEKFMFEIQKDDIWHDIFYTELTTGLLRGELCGLQWQDFDGQAGTLHIRRTVHSNLAIGETKTGQGTRKITLPPSTVEVLKQRKKSALTHWIFPNPLKPEQPMSPTSAYRKLKEILTKTDLTDMKFHDLRHTFATNALAGGLDVKTLSTIIGHVSTATTLNVYTHSTEKMKQEAARRIDMGMGNPVPQSQPQESKSEPIEFQPYKGKIRKRGTGCVSQIGEHLWEGRYSPKVRGKRYTKNIYAQTEAECEEKLAQLIAEMQPELVALQQASKSAPL